MKAIFSEDRAFRYLIWDVWDGTKPILAWCLYNPSVAGEDAGDGRMRDDHTWRKGVGFSQRLGYGGQVFCNLYAFIATKPAVLKAAGFPEGPENDGYILRACRMGDGNVVCAWGALARSRPARARKVLTLIRGAGFKAKALGTTVDGIPRHPLMLAYSTPMEDIR